MFGAICTFGCLCFAHNQMTHGDKYVSGNQKCVVVGYPFGKKILNKKYFLCLRMSNLLTMCSLLLHWKMFILSLLVLSFLYGILPLVFIVATLLFFTLPNARF